MLSIIKASLYKLIKDRPFKVTLIVGVVLAIIFTLFYSFVLPELSGGYNMLLISSSPTNNFGIAIPINLVVFIIGEFNYGTIRNKIIAGNKRLNIYIALFIMGLIFSFSLMTVYVGMSTLLGTILKGFFVGGRSATPGEVWATVGYTAIVYLTLTALSVLTATGIRHIGGSITVTIIVIVVASVAGLLTYVNCTLDGSSLPEFHYLINPLLILSVTTGSMGLLSGTTGEVGRIILFNILSNAIYTAIFLGSGILLFMNRDIK